MLYDLRFAKPERTNSMRRDSQGDSPGKTQSELLVCG